MKMFKQLSVCILAVVAMCGLQSQTQAATNVVRVLGGLGSTAPLTFSPTNITISPGDTITWTNTSGSAHDVTPGIKAGNTVNTNLPNPYWARINLAASQRGSVTFTNLGEFPYVCVTHTTAIGSPNQTGLVSVVTFNFPPTVGLTSPSTSTTLLAPGSLNITASAADSDGTITNLLIFVGANLVGQSSSGSASATVSELPGGNYVLTARATDNGGVTVTSAPVNVVVQHRVNYQNFAFAPPALTIKAGESILFTNIDGGFHTVSGSGTEQFCGSPTPVPIPFCQSTLNSTGLFPYRCVFHSPSQASGMTGAVTVATFNRNPTVRINGITEGTTLVTPVATTLQATAFDPDGSISIVQYYRDNTLIGAGSNPPYSVGVSNVPAGSYVLTARVIDNGGGRSTSAPVNITVISGPLVDVLLSAPVSGAEGFQFNYTANPGLRYIVEGSLNQDGPEPFTPIATNTANTNLVTFTDSTATGRTNRSYRVRRAP